jgi:hypothetical protein
VQYLDCNAFAKIKVFLGSKRDAAGNERCGAAKPRVQVGRGLTKEAWAFAKRMLDPAQSAAATHMRIGLAVACSTGLLRPELCGTFADDIGMRYAGAELGSIHQIRVVGKGAKERFVPPVF